MSFSGRHTVGTPRPQKALLRGALCLLVALPMVEAQAAGSYHLVDVTYGLGTERITAVEVHPRDGDTALVGVDGRVFKTDDGGESYRVVLSFHFGLAGDSEPTKGSTLRLLEDGADELLDETTRELGEGSGQVDDLDSDVLEDAGAEILDDMDGLPPGDASVDARAQSKGRSGPQVVFSRTLPGVRRLLFSREDPDVAYAATPMGLYRSLDRGEHFEEVPIPHGRGAQDVRDIAIHPGIPTHLIVATRAGSLESYDGGFTWAPLPGRVGKTASLCVLILPDSPTAFLVGTEEGLYRSDDGGRTYLRQLLAKGGRDQAVSTLAYDRERSALLVGTGRGLLMAGRSESLFQPLDLGLREVVERVRVSPVPGGPVLVAGRKGLYRLWLEKNKIENLLADGDVHGALDLAPDPRRKQVLYIATSRGLYRRIRGRGQAGIRIVRRRLEEVLRGEPSLEECVNAALRFARADVRYSQGMETRARLSAAFPRATVDYRLLLARDDGFGWGLGGVQGAEVIDEIADFYGDIYDVEPTYRQGISISLIYLTLRWDLDKLISHDKATRISREERRLRARRDKIIHRVVRDYTARRRALTKVVARSSRDHRVEVKRLMRLLEYTARLDAVTGGFFSGEARRRGGEAVIGVSYDGTPLPQITEVTTAALPSGSIGMRSVR